MFLCGNWYHKNHEGLEKTSLFVTDAGRNNRKYPLEFPHEPGSWTPEIRDGILKAPILPKDGYLKLPQEPGLGLSIDWKKVEQFGKQYFSMTEEELAVKVVEEKGLEIAFAIKERRDKAAEKKK